MLPPEVFIVLLLLLLLLSELASETADASCLEFCSNVLAAFTFRLDRCFELSLACCNPDFSVSRFEKIMLFVNLIAETALSAKLLTNFVYAFVMESGEVKLVTKLLKLSLYGLHADWSELITAFWDSMYSSDISLAVCSDCS